MKQLKTNVWAANLNIYYVTFLHKKRNILSKLQIWIRDFSFLQTKIIWACSLLHHISITTIIYAMFCTEHQVN